MSESYPFYPDPKPDPVFPPTEPEAVGIFQLNPHDPRRDWGMEEMFDEPNELDKRKLYRYDYDINEYVEIELSFWEKMKWLLGK